jgi:hypothetical protein
MKEPGLAERKTSKCTRMTLPDIEGPAIGRHPVRGRCCDGFPERAKARNPVGGSVAGDDRCVDRADRDARDPVRRVLRVGERFVDSGLVASKSASALKHQSNFLFVG